MAIVGVDIGVRQLKLIFLQTLRAASMAPLRAMMPVTSNGDGNYYPILGNSPAARKWMR